MKQKAIATYLGISDRRVRQLIADGIFKQDSHGDLTLQDCIKKFMEYKINLELKKNKPVNNNIDESEARLKAAKADEQELKVAILQEKYIEIETLKTELSKYVSNCKSKLLTIPIIAAIQIVNMSNITDIQELLKQLINDALLELSNNPYQADLDLEEDNKDDSREEQI